MKYDLMCLLIEFIFIFYLGSCIGLYIQCDYFKGMNPVKRYIWVVPFLQIRLSFIMIRKSIEEKRLSYFLSIFSIAENSSIILNVISNCIRESRGSAKSRKKYAQAASYKRMYRTVMAALVSVAMVSSI